MLPGDFKFGVDQGACGNPSKADDNLRAEQVNLIAQIPHAGVHLVPLGVTVFGRTAVNKPDSLEDFLKLREKIDELGIPV